MLARTLGFLGLTLALCVLGAQAGEDKFARQKEKDALVEPKKDAPKENNVPPKGTAEKGAAKGLTGTVGRVDPIKGSFTLTGAADTAKTILVTDGTKFLGPMGGNRGTGRDGLNDAAMSPGSTVRVVLADDGKNATEVHLSPRKNKK